MLTGDITHAKFANDIDSKQREEEWKVYDDILKQTKVVEKVSWLDIRGNHGMCQIKMCVRNVI